MVQFCGFEFAAFFVCLLKVQGGFGNERKEIARIAYPASEKSLQNLTVYLGYANNPFGPSTRLRQKKEHGLDLHFRYQLLKSEQLGEEDVLNNKISEGRSKRGVVQLYNMVSCSTGCNPLSYKGYGCYCGFLGSGYPVDGIDRCCQDHDWCYNTANCPMYLEYVVPYYWKCYKKRSLCAIDHMELGGSGSCAQRLCECDRILSECLSRYPCPKNRAVCTSSPWRFLQNALMLF